MKTAIVTTTIYMPVLLKDYCKNARQFGHADVMFIVVGDKKTPSGVADFCQKLAAEYSYTIIYQDVSTQLHYLSAYPALANHLPFNSIQRRNIGLLAAYQAGAELIITIDDDNFVQPQEDFIGAHSIVGQTGRWTGIQSSSGWYNVCELLTEAQNLPFYHRGYPLPMRWVEPETKQVPLQGKVVVNAGLWLEAPDIDALTRLDLPIEATAYKSEFGAGVMLAPGTWSPFNSQNTALAPEVVPAYFLSPLIGRYDDIWASYIIKHIADHLGHLIHFGTPIVRQKRNPHNYFKDFDQERLGMEATPQFIQVLQSISLKSQTYGACFAEIVEGLAARQEEFMAPSEFINGLRIWQEVHQKLSVRV